jgi:hypothetical protein
MNNTTKQRESFIVIEKKAIADWNKNKKTLNVEHKNLHKMFLLKIKYEKMSNKAICDLQDIQHISVNFSLLVKLVATKLDIYFLK